MKRKVVEQGSCTLMVSLPRDWGRRLDLKKGDDIFIEDLGGSLLLSPARTIGKRECQLNFSSHAESAIRIAIINMYRAGFDILHVKIKDDKQFDIISDVLQNYLVGLEITKREKGTCTIENVTEPSPDQFDVLFKKIIYNTSQMINQTIKRLNREIRFADYERVMFKIHQYDNFCRRVMARKGMNSGKVSFLWNFLSLLVHCPRELYHLNKYLDSHDVVFDAPNLLSALRECFTLLCDAYRMADLSKIERIHEQQDVLDEHINKLIGKEDSPIAVAKHVSNAIRNLQLSSSPLIGAIMGGKDI